MGHRRDRRLRRRRLRHVRRHAGARHRPGQPVRRVHGLDLRQAGRDRSSSSAASPRLANSNVGTAPVVVAAGAMGASIMVSYARAKSDGLGYSSGMGLAAVGVMPREVRLVIISLGIVLTGTGIGTSAIEFALGIILVGAVITVIQRILHVRSQAKSADSTTSPTNHRENGDQRGNQRQERQERHGPPTPGPARGAGATARSASPSSASATAPAASSRVATTTRTPRRTTSSRA